MKYLVLSSLIFVFVACSNSYISKLNFIEQRALSKNESEAIRTNIFENAKFKADVSAYGYEISGIFLLKKSDANIYKVGFLNYTGIVLFSFEISKDKFQLIYCLDQLNNQNAINIIEADLRTILFPSVPNGKVNVLSNANSGVKILNFTNEKKDLFYYIDSASSRLLGVHIAENDILTTSIQFHNAQKDTLKMINIKHFDFPLEIKLEEFVDEQ